jgi:hypothetical protein
MKMTNEVQTPVKNIVLVHGAWADGSNWVKVIPPLTRLSVASPPASR